MIYAVEEYTRESSTNGFKFIGATWYHNLQHAMDAADKINLSMFVVYVTCAFHEPKGEIQTQVLWCNEEGVLHD